MALGSDTQLKLPGVLNDKVLCFSNQLGMIMTSVSKDQMVMEYACHWQSAKVSVFRDLPHWRVNV